ncbi:MAG TPA: carbohydrate kinase, partial [Cryomorphaceae bacterium]|nr:carbohydrate kinase [Cryomorphaceae bacterium]
AGMNLMNLQSFDWDAQLLNATAPDLKNKLPSIVTGNHTVGTIAPYFVEKYGFDPKTEITVFTGDNPSSLVGTGG